MLSKKLVYTIQKKKSTCYSFYCEGVKFITTDTDFCSFAQFSTQVNVQYKIVRKSCIPHSQALIKVAAGKFLSIFFT